MVWNKGNRCNKFNCLNCKILNNTSDKDQKYCNMNCYRKASIGKKRSNETKIKMRNAQLGTTHSYKRRVKSSMVRTGEKEFTGFRRPFRARIRLMREYLKWRADIFKRDNYHCQSCGEKGYLEVHHIIPFSILMKEFNIKTIVSARECEELWDIGNGISYCTKCHIKNDLHRGKRGKAMEVQIL